MKKIGFLLLILSYDLFACPYCSGNGQGGKDSNTTLILGLFILAIYVPYFVIYKLIQKHKKLKEQHDNTGSSES